MFVVQATVNQMPVYVLATVSPVLVQVQTIVVRPTPHYVLEIVMSALAQAQHIVVQQMILFVLATLPHVAVKAVVQCLTVRHVPTLMVYAELQHVVIILAGMIPRTSITTNVQLVRYVVVARA